MNKLNAIVILLLIINVSCTSIQENKDFAAIINGEDYSMEQIQTFLTEIDNNVEVRELEKAQFILADEIEGFGGYYYDKEGDHFLYLKGRSSYMKNSGRIRLNEVMEKGNLLNDVYFELIEAQFEFKELANYRDRISNLALPNEEFDFIQYVDLDERRNRVVIAYDNATISPRLLDLEHYIINILNVPSTAIIYEGIEPIISNNYSYGPTSLNGRLSSLQRPLVGGLGIFRGTNLGLCTLGFVAKLDNKDVFITNSHCTSQQFSLDNSTTFFQGVHSPNYIIGTEFKDPNTWSCGQLLPPFHNCRWSDASAIRIVNTSLYQRGKIARTEYKGTSSDGSKDIIGTDPTFSIAKSNENISTGTYINKVGRESGWTAGYVTATCVDAHKGGPFNQFWIMKCQNKANYRAKGGDSGAPVFRFIYDVDGWEHASLLGIHWGSSSSTTSYYSPISGIVKDLGNIYAIDPSSNYVAPPPSGGGPGVIDDPCVINPLNCHEQ